MGSRAMWTWDFSKRVQCILQAIRENPGGVIPPPHPCGSQSGSESPSRVSGVKRRLSQPGERFQ